jgi:23S rRNA (cytosine1962-C5)-methyltransferase
VALATLRLKRHEERRLRAGHLWVFSNEVDVERTPLTNFEAGQPVVVEDSGGRPLGSAYVTPRALICARLVSRDARRPLDGALLRARVDRALSLRERLFPGGFYRLVFGEGDGLPGLVVDRYGDIVAAQITTAGMECLKDEVLGALQGALAPRGVVLRNDTPVRALEGLPSYVEAVGAVPEELELAEHGARFVVPLLRGQKTGWFYDQRLNRQRMLSYAANCKVLDCFSYTGAWGVQAALAGASKVVCLDSSDSALGYVQRNAAQNGVADRIETVRGDALEMLSSLGDEFDLAVVDPPAFIKRKKDSVKGEQAYLRLNTAAMRCLAPGGFLISSSCSYHLPAERLQRILLAAARSLGRELQLLEQGGQGPDHPVHPAIPETRYLKTFFARLLPD